MFLVSSRILRLASASHASQAAKQRAAGQKHDGQPLRLARGRGSAAGCNCRLSGGEQAGRASREQKKHGSRPASPLPLALVWRRARQKRGRCQGQGVLALALGAGPGGRGEERGSLHGKCRNRAMFSARAIVVARGHPHASRRSPPAKQRSRSTWTIACLSPLSCRTAQHVFPQGGQNPVSKHGIPDAPRGCPVLIGPRAGLSVISSLSARLSCAQTPAVGICVLWSICL